MFLSNMLGKFKKANFTKQIDTNFCGKNIKVKVEVNSNADPFFNDANFSPKMSKIVRLLNKLPLDKVGTIDTKFIEKNHKEIIRKCLHHPLHFEFFNTYRVSTFVCLTAPHIFSDSFVLKTASVILGCSLMPSLLNNLSGNGSSLRRTYFYPRLRDIFEYMDLETYRKKEIYKILLTKKGLNFDNITPLLEESLIEKVHSLSINRPSFGADAYYELSDIRRIMEDLLSDNKEFYRIHLQKILKSLFDFLESKKNSEVFEKEIRCTKLIIQIFIDTYSPDRQLLINDVSLECNLAHYNV